MDKTPFIEKLHSGDRMVADGAMGTTLQSLGLPTGIPGEVVLHDNPELILEVHRRFIEAGADILLTCSFGGTAIRLESAGLKDRVEAVNQKAVELACQAGSDQTYIAGSMGPTGQLLEPMGSLTQAAAEAAYAEQARFLAAAGVDLLVTETHFDLGEARAAVRAIRSACSLPLVCSFSFDRGTRTMMGVRPAQMTRELTDWGVDVIGINCGRSLDENIKVLAEVRAATTLPVWFKPNAGLPVLDENRKPFYETTPEKMAARVPQALDGGAQIVGGCCGTSPDHLAMIARAVRGWATRN